MVYLSLLLTGLALGLLGAALRWGGRLEAPASGQRCSWWSLEVVGSWDQEGQRASRVYLSERSHDPTPPGARLSFNETRSEGLLDDLKSGQTLTFGHYTFANPPLSRADHFTCTEQIARPGGAGIAFAASALLLLAGLGGMLLNQPAPAPARVAMVGIDGGDWSVLDPLIEQGLMPNLARIRSEGATADLVISSAQSPDSWTTLASGHLPEVHGVSQTGATMVGGTFAATPRQVKVMRLWDMVSSQGRTVFVTNYWVTGPAYPINGVMVPREPGEAWPVGADKRLEDWAPENHAQEVQRLGLGLAKSGTTTWWLDKPERFDLVILPFYGHDQGLHMLWQEFDQVRSGAVEELSPERRARAEQAHGIILETARLADRWLGYAMEYVGDEGYIVLVSDHGHRAANPPTRRIAISRELLDGKRGTLESGTVHSGRVTIELLQQRRNVTQGLGYELSYPIVELTGDEEGAVAARLLAATTDEGQPLFRQAGTHLVPSEALFDAVDLALGRLEQQNFSVFVNTGSHSIDEKGIFGVYGPGVKPGPIPGEVRSLDATPTVLWLMGLPAGQDQTGRPITAALTDPPSVEFVPTYETGRRPWATQDAPGGLSPEEIEWLKAMGYLDAEER